MPNGVENGKKAFFWHSRINPDIWLKVFYGRPKQTMPLGWYVEKLGYYPDGASRLIGARTIIGPYKYGPFTQYLAMRVAIGNMKNEPVRPKHWEFEVYGWKHNSYGNKIHLYQSLKNKSYKLRLQPDGDLWQITYYEGDIGKDMGSYTFLAAMKNAKDLMLSKNELIISKKDLAEYHKWSDKLPPERIKQLKEIIEKHKSAGRPLSLPIIRSMLDSTIQDAKNTTHQKK